jgi:hypothetical protein
MRSGECPETQKCPDRIIGKPQPIFLKVRGKKKFLKKGESWPRKRNKKAVRFVKIGFRWTPFAAEWIGMRRT